VEDEDDGPKLMSESQAIVDERQRKTREVPTGLGSQRPTCGSLKVAADVQAVVDRPRPFRPTSSRRSTALASARWSEKVTQAIAPMTLLGGATRFPEIMGKIFRGQPVRQLSCPQTMQARKRVARDHRRGIIGIHGRAREGIPRAVRRARERGSDHLETGVAMILLEEVLVTLFLVAVRHGRWRSRFGFSRPTFRFFRRGKKMKAARDRLSMAETEAMVRGHEDEIDKVNTWLIIAKAKKRRPGQK